MINQLLYFEGLELDVVNDIDNLLLTSNYVIIKSATIPINITGFDAGSARKSYFSITIINKSDNTVTLKHQSPNSNSGNRLVSNNLLLGIPQDVVIKPGEYKVCVYNQDNYIIQS